MNGIQYPMPYTMDTIASMAVKVAATAKMVNVNGGLVRVPSNDFAVEMKHAFVKPASVVEKKWLSRIDSIKDAKPEEIETLLAQMELLMIHAGKKFCVQVNPQGFARIAMTTMTIKSSTIVKPFCLI
jgi:hypothetical protein